ncbi:MAG: HPr(Ser) kinase/phosphatase [Proteobacteria bacterium]|nr:HPr(Ser) kinase/phosphatase [Pseudomonadota bacterium]MBU2567579.1 HPr(Ser) kinase/phosphatase [Elusimicrobiota bacterium]
MEKLNVERLLKETGDILSMKVLAGSKGLHRRIDSPDVSRLGLTLAGHFAYFPAERLQLFGMTEQTYLETLSASKRETTLRQLFSAFPQIPCIVITRNIEPFAEMMKLCEENSLPLIRTSLKTAKFITEISLYLENKVSADTAIHGVLVDVYGIGTLIMGESGIGKSECALELVKRGHMLVADDVLDIRLHSGSILIGAGNDLIRHHMEVRGLGIIDIRAIFGTGSVLDSTRIELVVKLEEWTSGSEYDRVGMEEKTMNILGVEMPQVIIPVMPGRNLAVLVEVASLNQRLKQKGHYTARELNKKLIEKMASGQKDEK